MKPTVTIRPEGALYSVTTDFGDVAVIHRFATRNAAEWFVAGRGRKISVSMTRKSSVKPIGANVKTAQATRTDRGRG